MRHTFTRSTAGAAFVLAAALVVSARRAEAQVRPIPVEADLAGVEILGPPPPVAPAVINRDSEGGATLRAVRVTEPHRVDGVLDEAIYRTTLPITGFIQTLPDEGGEPSEETEAWVAFDDDNVYVSARVWDSGG